MPARAPALTVLLTVVTLLAFAGNSLLCRAALAGGAIDPLSFTALRLASGALVLLPFLPRGPATRDGRPWSPLAGLALAGYSLAFSLAYVSLDAGTGALLLFGMVQVTMIGAGLRAGDRLGARRWLGLAAALGGVSWLVSPGVSAPAPGGAALMCAAGVGWGVYSLAGRGVAVPAAATARHFVLAAPLAALALVLARGGVHVERAGLGLAVTSGALTSGLGYVVWYAALGGLSAASASIVQLAVPVVAALGGVLLLGESWSARLVLASVLTLGGVACATLAPQRSPAPKQ
jgi:drug/metabolite transporter (DMT)-like permease